MRQYSLSERKKPIFVENFKCCAFAYCFLALSRNSRIQSGSNILPVTFFSAVFALFKFKGRYLKVFIRNACSGWKGTRCTDLTPH